MFIRKEDEPWAIALLFAHEGVGRDIMRICQKKQDKRKMTPVCPVKVGVRRFELPAPTSLTWCANRAALHPEFNIAIHLDSTIESIVGKLARHVGCSAYQNTTQAGAALLALFSGGNISKSLSAEPQILIRFSL